MNKSGKTLKKLLGKYAIVDFRTVLYSTAIPSGAKMLLFAIWDLPESQDRANMSLLARKIHCSPATVFRWKKEMRDIKLSYFDKG